MTIIVHEWDSDARCKRCLIPKALAPKPQLCPGKPPAARAAARMRWPLDGADAQALEAALSLTERERDEAKGRMRRACQLLVEEVGANGPADVDKMSERAAVLIRELRDQVNGLRAAAEESEHQMHLRIRAGYDKTIADSWRAKVAEVERERDAARDAYKFRGGYVEDASGDRWWSVGLLSKAEQERDEARAEVERLRERLVATETEVALMCATAEREAASSPNGADRTEAAERALAYGAVLELLRKGRG